MSADRIGGGDMDDRSSDSSSGAVSAGGPDIDLYDPTVQEHWFDAYDRLRSQAPVYRMPGTDTFVLTRYADVVDVSRRTDVFANGPSPREPLITDPEAIAIARSLPVTRRAPLGSDPPIHRTYRSAVDPLFSVAGVARWRPMIQRAIDDLLDGFPGDGVSPVEFVSAFALPLPVHVITTMLGLPLSDLDQLKAWSEAWVMPFAGNLTPEQQQFTMRERGEFQRYLLNVVDHKRRNPDDSVTAALIAAGFADDEIVPMLDHLYIGGNETTTFALTSALWLLLRQPDLVTTLHDDVSLIPAFVEEALRLESPTQGLSRHALVDTTVGEVTIPQGCTVHLRFGAANRDPAVFASPDQVHLQRGVRQVAFGIGEHHCPGAGLSRVEQQMAWTSILSRFGDIGTTPEVLASVRHLPGFTLRAIPSLLATFAPMQSA
jgi:cytochrome P450